MADELKLDLGCGRNKQPGYIGVDRVAFEGVDRVLDLREAWPWDNDSVSEVHSSHFLEHLTMPERLHFVRELYRVLRPGGQARIITPHWSHACAYGDPTHQWPPVTEWFYYYLKREWREQNAPHLSLDCNFDFVVAGSWDPWLEPRNAQTREFAMQHYVNSFRDLIVTLIKR